jgi:hypothetical protein
VKYVAQKAIAGFATVLSTCTNALKEIPLCENTSKQIETAAMQLIAENLDSTECLSTDETLNVGENRSNVCAAFDNSGANAITKALQDVATQFGTNLVNGAVQPR